MPAWRLTSREREVAELIIEGRPTDDIAASLFLSPHTVRDYTKAIFGKVGVHTRRDLAASLTGQHGMIQPANGTARDTGCVPDAGIWP